MKRAPTIRLTLSSLRPVSSAPRSWRILVTLTLRPPSVPSGVSPLVCHLSHLTPVEPGYARASGRSSTGKVSEVRHAADDKRPAALHSLRSLNRYAPFVPHGLSTHSPPEAGAAKRRYTSLPSLTVPFALLGETCSGPKGLLSPTGKERDVSDERAERSLIRFSRRSFIYRSTATPACRVSSLLSSSRYAGFAPLRYRRETLAPYVSRPHPPPPRLLRSRFGEPHR